ncbi:MAG: AbrB/MazE/SpoVT family DNA-binding domain-containing protein [Nanoarchaeota archaeon]
MKRKIIRQGHNTLTVTLPMKWAKRFNLHGGDEIDLLEKDNGLFIGVEKSGESKKVSFDISNMDIPTIWKHFMAVYREGYDEVKVMFNPEAMIDNPYKFFSAHRVDMQYKKLGQKRPIVEVLQGFVNRFIGFEIVEHGKDYILIKEMGMMSSREFDNSLRRIFLLIQQMAEETNESINSGDQMALVHMHDVDINIDKFHDYCVRVLNKLELKDEKKKNLYFSTLYLMELVGDEYKNIANHLVNDFPKVKFNTLTPQKFREYV